jgi:hypothetical protein
MAAFAILSIEALARRYAVNTLKLSAYENARTRAANSLIRACDQNP